MLGLKNREEVGEVLAGWLAISGGQVTTSCSEESKLPTNIAFVHLENKIK
jgi:hypothetical protein